MTSTTDTKLCEPAQVVVDRLVRNASFELPLLPESTAKLLSICNDRDFPPTELAESIRRDQSIATHVLRMANSAMFMPGSPVVSLQQAVARLGIDRIREIVLIVSCKSRVFDVAGFESEIRDSFKHSLAAAIFAQEIARARRLNVEDAFLCGLLHDIGRPVLLQAIVDYQHTNRVLVEREEVLQAIESHRATVGGNLINLWKLPQRIAHAVLQQNSNNTESSDDTANILQLAITFTNAYFAPEEVPMESLLSHPTVDSLNLYPDQLEEVRTKSEELIELLGEAS